MLFELFMKKHWFKYHTLTKKDLEATTIRKPDIRDKYHKSLIVPLATLSAELQKQWYILEAITISWWLQDSPEYVDMLMWAKIIKSLS